MDISVALDCGVFNYRVAAVWIKNDCILLHKALKDEHWALPGGRVEFSEDATASLCREIYEEGLYYTVNSTNEEFDAGSDYFHGVEDTNHIYKWFSLDELDSVLLYPEFLRKSLKEIPNTTQHIVEFSQAGL